MPMIQLTLQGVYFHMYRLMGNGCSTCLISSNKFSSLLPAAAAAAPGGGGGGGGGGGPIVGGVVSMVTEMRGGINE